MCQNAKVLLEKQNRELKEKLSDLEEANKGRSKAVIANLEAKIATLEEQMNLEANEKQRVAREYKRSEKRLREMLGQVEEERKLTESYKEQVNPTKTFFIPEYFLNV